MQIYRKEVGYNEALYVYAFVMVMDDCSTHYFGHGFDSLAHDVMFGKFNSWTAVADRYEISSMVIMKRT